MQDRAIAPLCRDSSRSSLALRCLLYCGAVAATARNYRDRMLAIATERSVGSSLAAAFGEFQCAHHIFHTLASSWPLTFHTDHSFHSMPLPNGHDRPLSPKPRRPVTLRRSQHTQLARVCPALNLLPPEQTPTTAPLQSNGLKHLQNLTFGNILSARSRKPRITPKSFFRSLTFPSPQLPCSRRRP